MGLARDVIKWLQSLDLEYSFSKPQRDFANGYLIAIIFSRYYIDLTPYKMYTGDSLSQKQNNWQVLSKFFNKHKINIPEEAIEAVIHCQKGAAIQFVENIYSLLTSKEVKRPSTPSQPGYVPHFALPTTCNAIRVMAESPEKADMVMAAHNEFLKQLRKQRKIKENLSPKAQLNSGNISQIHVRQ